METGSFPVVRKKPKRPVKDGSARMRLMTSVLILIMCALLGYGYMIQINNADATYETLSEDRADQADQRDRHTRCRTWSSASRS